MNVRTLKQQFRALALNKRVKNTHFEKSLVSQTGIVPICNNCNSILADCKCQTYFNLKEIISVLDFFQQSERKLKSCCRQF